MLLALEVERPKVTCKCVYTLAASQSDGLPPRRAQRAARIVAGRSLAKARTAACEDGPDATEGRQEAPLRVSRSASRSRRRRGALHGGGTSVRARLFTRENTHAVTFGQLPQG